MKKVKIGAVAGMLVMVLCVMFAWALPFTATIGSMGTARGDHAATLLPDGKVLITGGTNGTGDAGSLDTAYLYDPAAKDFTATTSPMNAKRYAHSAASYTVGGVVKVLVTGGRGNSGALNTAETYIGGVFTTTSAPMISARFSHTSTLLSSSSNTVLIVGGNNGSADLNTAELYDAVGDTFIATTSNMTSSRALHTATLLPDGTVLIAGGHDGATVWNTAEIYDPLTDTFGAASGTMGSARCLHSAVSFTVGGVAKVLITGGSINQDGTAALNTAEIYDPVLKTFSAAGTMVFARNRHTSTQLPDGTILIAGGYDGTPGTGMDTAEIYDPATDSFYATTLTMVSKRVVHVATALQDGTVLLAGGYYPYEPINAVTALSSAEIFDVTQDISDTTTLLVSSIPTSTRGETVTFTATVSCATDTRFPFTGEVIFSDSSTTLATVAISGGVASYSTSTLALNDHLITARYSGDRHFKTSTSNDTGTQHVSLNATAVAVTSSPTPSIWTGQTVTFTATVTSAGLPAYSGTVVFSDGSTTLAAKTISSGGVASFGTNTLTGGSHTITATYSGDGNYDVSTNTGTLDVNKGVTTTTLTSLPTTSIKTGQTYTFTATVTNATGTAIPFTGSVVFSEGSTTLATKTISGGGVALYTTSTLTAGSHDITATYSGDVNFDISSDTQTRIVNLNNPTITMTTSQASIKTGVTVTYTAVVSKGSVTAAVTGDVTFYSNGTTTLGTGTIYSNGTATVVYSAFTSEGNTNYNITATYNGDLNYSAQTTTAVTQNVIRSATTTTVSSSLNPATTVDPVTFTATVSQVTTTGTSPMLLSGGTVTFKNNGVVLGAGTVSGDNLTGVATFVMSALTVTNSGSYAITAEYGGDSNYLLSTSATLTQVVNKAASTFTLGNLSQIYSASTKTVSIASSNPPGLLWSDVTFTFSTATNPNATPVSAGTYTVTAAIKSTSTRTGTATGTLTIAPRDLTIVGMKANTRVYNGDINSSMTTTPGTLVGVQGIDSLTFTASGAFGDKNIGTGKTVLASTITVTLSSSNTSTNNYNLIKPTDVTGAITAKSLTVSGMTVTSRPYNRLTTASTGTTGALVGVIVNDVVAVDTVTMNFTSAGTGTNKPVTVSAITLAGTDAGNYTVTLPMGLTGTITPRPLTVTAIGKNKIYDKKRTTTVTFTTDRISPDSLIVTYASASFVSEQTGTQTINISGIRVGGTSAVNYAAITAGTATTSAFISQKPLIIVGMKATTIPFDGGVTAPTFTGRAKGTLSGILTGDTVTFSVGPCTYASVTAGVGKKVVLGPLTLFSNGNYTVTKLPIVTGVITPKQLTVSGITVANKVYDRTTRATANLSGASLSGTVGSYATVTILNATMAFKDKYADTVPKPVVTTSVTLGGADAANYLVTKPTWTTSATISKASLTVTILNNIRKNKAYDGKPISLPTYTDTRIKGDVVTVRGNARYVLVSDNTTSAKDVGDHLISAVSITTSGPDARNYTLTGTTATASGSITRKRVSITGIRADSRGYDGTNAVTFVNPLTKGKLSGVVSSETHSVMFSIGTSTFADQFVGASKLVSLGAVSWQAVDGVLASNYTVVAPAKVYGTITKKILNATNITATADDRPYAADDTHAVVHLSLTNPISGDNLVLTGVGTFADPNPNLIGSPKTVTVRSIQIIGGTNVTQYTLATGVTVTTTANIY